MSGRLVMDRLMTLEKRPRRPTDRNQLGKTIVDISVSEVEDQQSRGASSRFSSTATRSGFIPSWTRRSDSVEMESNSRSSPLMMSFMD